MAEGRRRISKWIHGLRHRHYPRVLANSMPKAGTHLLVRLLALLEFREWRGAFDVGPGEGIVTLRDADVQRVRYALSSLAPGWFVRSHMYYYPEIDQALKEIDIRVITIVRDPRDVCVSDAFHIAKRPDHRLHRYYAKMSDSERLMASIVGMDSNRLSGGSPSLDIGTHYRNYVGWTDQHCGIVVKFEDLIGEKGGGDNGVQKETVRRIRDFLGLKLSDNATARLCSALFWPGAKTFREGKVASWRRHFESEHMAAFKRVIGSVMTDFGYAEE